MNAQIESVVHAAPNVVEEAFEELTGESKRKWGLVALSFLLGVIAVTAVIRFALRKATHSVVTPDPDATAKTSDSQVPTGIDSSHSSVRPGIRAQVARAEAAARERIHHLARRVPVRRHASVRSDADGPDVVSPPRT